MFIEIEKIKRSFSIVIILILIIIAYFSGLTSYLNKENFDYILIIAES